MDQVSVKESDKEEEEDKIANPPQLRLITGGKGGPGGKDWLTPMPVGTTFMCRIKSDSGFILTQFHVFYKCKKAIILLNNFYGKDEKIPVDPIRFCQLWELYEEQE